MSADTLQAVGIGVDFAGLKALSEVDLVLEQSEILGLIGPNGAGKTTLVNVLSGFQRPTTGRVLLGSRDVTGAQPHKLAVRGLGRTFQSVRLFARLTVFENVMAGAIAGGLRMRPGPGARLEPARAYEPRPPGPAPGGRLPHGEERRLGSSAPSPYGPASCCWTSRRRDSTRRRRELMTTLAALPRDYALGLLVIEHDMSLILGLCNRIQVLDYGKTIAEGSPDEVRQGPAVIEAYLGAVAVPGGEIRPC